MQATPYLVKQSRKLLTPKLALEICRSRGPRRRVLHAAEVGSQEAERAATRVLIVVIGRRHLFEHTSLFHLSRRSFFSRSGFGSLRLSRTDGCEVIRKGLVWCLTIWQIARGVHGRGKVKLIVLGDLIGPPRWWKDR